MPWGEQESEIVGVDHSEAGVARRVIRALEASTMSPWKEWTGIKQCSMILKATVSHL
jgi:hypothetical protein